MSKNKIYIYNKQNHHRNTRIWTRGTGLEENFYTYDKKNQHVISIIGYYFKNSYWLLTIFLKFDKALILRFAEGILWIKYPKHQSALHLTDT